MTFPNIRMRRLRQSEQIRAMVRETHLSPANFVMPIFVVPGKNIKREISSMPGQHHYSIDRCAERANELRELGVPAVLLFGIPEYKDDTGSAACQENGIVQQAVRAIKPQVPEITIMTDLCFCEYTSHGHCGFIEGTKLLNDPTLEMLVEQAVSHASAGADVIAPSGMMDGMVGALRRGLDGRGFTETVIMSYAAKFASSFYGPFREAVQSAPSFGDRKTYQMDPANSCEALREVELDVQEGADIIMVKPAMAFLDIVYAVKQKFGLPTAAYNVSGEYAMVKAAADRGWIDGRKVMQEVLLSIRRAGADIIITYFAEEYAELYRRGALDLYK
jgi:porphobilinogen synthase